MSAFVDADIVPPLQLAPGLLARAVHADRMTLAVVELDPDTVAAGHQHDNEQIGIVVQGSALFRVGDEERELGPGCVYTAPSGVLHGLTAGPEGAVLVEVFAGPRADWVGREPLKPRPGTWPGSP